jgi:Na+/proline symporter
MTFISQSTGYLFLLLFGIAMFFVTYFFARRQRTIGHDGFLVAGRKVG